MVSARKPTVLGRFYLGRAYFLLSFYYVVHVTWHEFDG